MSATALPASPDGRKISTELVVEGVRNPRSLGISRYATKLAEALGQEQVDYRLDDRQTGDGPAHFHLANSSRAFLRRAPSPDAPSSSPSTTSCLGRARFSPSIGRSCIRGSLGTPPR